MDTKVLPRANERAPLDGAGDAEGADRSGGGIQVIARAASVLRSLKHERAGLSLAQIRERAGLPRSTVLRIVNALVQERLVTAAGPEGGYRLGPEIQALANSARADMVAFARPYLTALSQATGETVDLAAFRGDHLVFVDQIVGSHRLRAVSAVGEAFPLSTTANGKAVLSLLDREHALELVRRERAELRAASTKPLRQLEEELAQARASGIAFDEDEHSAGISAAGFALRDASGEIYAISVPVPSQRFETLRTTIVQELLATRQRLSRALGVAEQAGPQGPVDA